MDRTDVFEQLRDATVTVLGVDRDAVTEGARFFAESMARYDALRARSFVIGSFGKTYHVTGWKVGYVAAPEPLSTEFQVGPFGRVVAGRRLHGQAEPVE